MVTLPDALLRHNANLLAQGLIRTMELADTDECPLCGGAQPPCSHVIAAHEIIALLAA